MLNHREVKMEPSHDGIGEVVKRISLNEKLQIIKHLIIILKYKIKIQSPPHCFSSYMRKR